MKKLVFSGPKYCEGNVIRKLGDLFEIQLVQPEPNSLIPALQNSNVFLDASMKVPITYENIMSATNLEMIATATTGTSHIDARAIEEKGITLLSLKGQSQILNSLTPAAEHTWGLIIAAARKFRGAIEHTDNEHWDRINFPGMMLKGKKIGIIGFGRIGSWIARYANAFNMEVFAHDPYGPELPDNVTSTDLETLVSISDIITLHVHLSDSTRNMLNEELISKFKKNSIFVNTSRGELVDELAIIDSMKAGKLSAIGVDVLQNEPELSENPIWNYAKENKNVIITPHIGGFCPEAVELVVNHSCDRILTYFGFR